MEGKSKGLKVHQIFGCVDDNPPQDDLASHRMEQYFGLTCRGDRPRHSRVMLSMDSQRVMRRSFENAPQPVLSKREPPTVA